MRGFARVPFVKFYYYLKLYSNKGDLMRGSLAFLIGLLFSGVALCADNSDLYSGSEFQEADQRCADNSNGNSLTYLSCMSKYEKETKKKRDAKENRKGDKKT
jgi:hypothetical protein